MPDPRRQSCHVNLNLTADLPRSGTSRERRCTSWGWRGACCRPQVGCSSETTGAGPACTRTCSPSPHASAARGRRPSLRPLHPLHPLRALYAPSTRPLRALYAPSTRPAPRHLGTSAPRHLGTSAPGQATAHATEIGRLLGEEGLQQECREQPTPAALLRRVKQHWNRHHVNTGRFCVRGSHEILMFGVGQWVLIKTPQSKTPATCASLTSLEPS